LYFLADKMLDPVAADMVMDKLMRRTEASKTYPSIALVTYVYTSTTSGSPLRKVIRDWYFYKVEWPWPSSLNSNKWPYDFMRDLLMKHCTTKAKNPNGLVRKVYAKENSLSRHRYFQRSGEIDHTV
jgi:hypothetical protein